MKKVLIAFILIIFLTACIADPSLSRVDPMDKARRALPNLIDTPGSPQKTCANFLPDSIIASKPIVEAMEQLGSDQACVLIGESLADDARFDVITNGKAIRYTGNLEQSAKMWLICDRGEYLATDLEDLGLDTEFNINNCGDDFLSYASSPSRICLIGISEEDEDTYCSGGMPTISPLRGLIVMVLLFLVFPALLILGFVLGRKEKYRLIGIAIQIIAIILFLFLLLSILGTPL